jgi:PD-(D/E)XK endonuclease
VDLRAVAPRTSSHPVDVGQRTEGAILSELVRRGYDVLVPFGTNQRYDLVLDLDGELVRVQCKTGRLRDGTVRFSTQSIQSNTRRTVMRGYLGDADLFLVYCPEIGKVYVVPVEEVGVSKTYLRVDPVRNGQSHGVRWAEDYELPG